MRRIVVATTTAAFVAVGCGDVVGPDELLLQFTTDSSQFYSGSSSPGCSPYCRAWRRDTVSFNAVLRIDGGSAVLSSDADYSGTGSFGGTVSATLTAPAPGCRSITLSGSRSGGTFSHQQDCHGLSRAGRYRRL